MEKQSSEKRFALLIDADNVSSKYIKPITDELSKYGTVTYKRIYGDWTLTLHAKWKDALLENSITPIQQFGYTQGKNATDSAMIIDAMDILYTRSVEGFCIVSSDSDFTRLASRIRESGLTVIGMGEKKTPTPFRKACDIFTTLELLLGDASGKNGSRGKTRSEQGTAALGQSSSLSIDEVEQAVVNIITDNQNNGKSTGLGEVGSRLLKRYPDFDVRSYGTNLLSKLLDEFASVQITKEGSSVTVELTDDKDRVRKQQSDKESQAESRDVASDPASSKIAGAEKTVSSAVSSSQKGAPKVMSSSKTKVSQKPAEAPAVLDAEDEPVSHELPVAIIPAGKKPRRSTRMEANHGRGVSDNADAVLTAPASEEIPEASAALKDTESQGGDSPMKESSVLEEVSLPEGTVEEKGAKDSSSSDNRPGRAGRRKAAASKSAPSKAVRAKTTSRDKKSASVKPVSAEGGEQDAARAFEPGEIEAYVKQTVSTTEPEGIPLATLGKRVRAKFRSFKLRDLGYSQFRPYLEDMKSIELEQRDGQYFAHLAK